MIQDLARRMVALLGRLRWCPHRPTPKQLTFLALDQREALYGGAAGGGKSDALLMGALEWVDVPGYAALLLRRTYAELNKPDGLIPRSHAWLAGTAARWNGELKQWTFPSGATLSFGYLDAPNDHYQYQGPAYQYIGFDELTHFREHQYRYMFSRLRRLVGQAVPLRVRSGSNPGGSGHWWVFERFVETRNPKRPFIPARLEDNPYLDREEYEASLAELDEVERARLRWGDWHVQREGLVYPTFRECLVPSMPELLEGRPIGGIDFGWNNPFAAEWGAEDRDGVLWLWGERYGSRCPVSEHAKHLPKVWTPISHGGKSRGEELAYEWLCDPAGADQIAELRVAGHAARPSVHIGREPLQHGIDLVNRRIRSGRLKVVEGACPSLRREAGLYHYEEGKATERPVDADNHALAALRYMVVGLDRLRGDPDDRPRDDDEQIEEPEPYTPGWTDDDDDGW